MQEIIEEQLNTIPYLLLAGIEPDGFQKLAAVLESYSKLLQRHNLQVTVTFKKYFCERCRCQVPRFSPEIIQLNCGHIICSLACLQQLIFDCVGQDLHDIHLVLCPNHACGSRIDEIVMINAFGGEQNLEDFVYVGSGRPLFQCCKCEAEFPVYYLRTLDCEERYCNQCLSEHCTAAAELEEFVPIICIVCDKEIDTAIIKSVLSSELFAKWEEKGAIQFKDKA
jgi:hypothetical protein